MEEALAPNGSEIRQHELSGSGLAAGGSPGAPRAGGVGAASRGYRCLLGGCGKGLRHQAGLGAVRKGARGAGAPQQPWLCAPRGHCPAQGVGGHSTPAVLLGGGHKKVGDTPRARASCHQEPHIPLDRGRRDRVLALSTSPQILLQPPSPLGTQPQHPKSRCPPHSSYTGSERAAGCQLWPCWLHGLMDRP